MDMFLVNKRVYNIPYEKICKTIEEYMENEDEEVTSTDRKRFLSDMNIAF
tara:strand:- start:1343 stop:1492 length:150 start_codon:yes stop_codon:yes gene_type:complete